MREEDLFNLSDDDLDKAFAEAKASLESPITDIEDNYTEEIVEMDVEDNEPLTLDKPEEAESDDDLDGTDSVIDNRIFVKSKMLLPAETESDYKEVESNE